MYVVASDTNKPYVSFNNQWNELLLTSSSIDGLADVDTTTVAPQNGQVLKWNGANWAPANDLTGGGGGGLALTDLSASTAAASGGGAFAYNNGTGVFTYTPPLPESDTLSSVASRGKTSYVLNGGYGTRQVAVVGSDVFSSNLTIFDNDTFFVGTNDRTLFGHRNGALTWCGDDGSGNTDWQNRKFELKHLDSSQNTNASYALAGALYLKSDDGYPISIGNDTGDIQLGNNSGSIKYLTASSTATKLFLNGAEKLSTTASGVTITGSLTAGGLTYPTSNGNSGQILTSDGAGNVTWQDGGSGNTQVSIGDTIPAGTASAGDLWWESDTGRLKIYYQDTDSSQWVDVNPPLRQDRIASTGAPSSATDTGVAGDIRYDSSYVYIAVGTNTWKRAALTTW